MTTIRFQFGFAALAFLCILPLTPVQGQSMTLERFQRETDGQTYLFIHDGITYGMERYLPRNRVEWSILDGRCIFGKYFEWKGKICFSYDEYGRDAERPPQCWTFERRDGVLMAQFYDPDRDHPPVEMRLTNQELSCLGPDVGS